MKRPFNKSNRQKTKNFRIKNSLVGLYADLTPSSSVMNAEITAKIRDQSNLEINNRNSDSAKFDIKTLKNELLSNYANGKPAILTRKMKKI